MRYLVVLLLTLCAFPVGAQTYPEDLARAAALRSAPPSQAAERREAIVQHFDLLAGYWLGTTWGLGAPQTSTPGDGKINCGTFVGTLLRALGFEVDVKKLQRQPAELIIKTFSPPPDIRRFRNTSMDAFLEGVREMGDGLYIIGLDFHVGFLRVKSGEVRFVHASYVTSTVVDELADSAVPITTSKYRVVGKLLSADMLESWVAGKVIPVKGRW